MDLIRTWFILLLFFKTYSCSSCCSGDKLLELAALLDGLNLGEAFGGAVIKSLSTKWPSPSIEFKVSHTTVDSLRKPWSVTSKNNSWNQINENLNTIKQNVERVQEDLHSFHNLDFWINRKCRFLIADTFEEVMPILSTFHYFLNKAEKILQALKFQPSPFLPFYVLAQDTYNFSCLTLQITNLYIKRISIDVLVGVASLSQTFLSSFTNKLHRIWFFFFKTWGCK